MAVAAKNGSAQCILSPPLPCPQVSGALVIRAVPGAKVSVGPLVVSNKGWSWAPLAEGDKSATEEERIR